MYVSLDLKTVAYSNTVIVAKISSGVARPGPTRACALPSTFQALPSAAKHDSRDSIKNWKYSSYSS